MAAEKNGNNTNGRLVALVLAILGAFGGGFGSNYFWVKNNPDTFLESFRPDPFTGEQGRALERRIDSATADLRELKNRVDRMDPEEVASRLLIIEHEIRELKKDVARHRPD